MVIESRSAGLRGEKVGEEDEEVSVDEDDVEEANDSDAVGEWRFEFAMIAAAAAAALAALLMGTWMPSEGRERDLRRVLYGMMGGGRV